MPNTSGENTYKEIPIEELTPGMYVTSISSKNQVRMKSEGYIKTSESIEKLIAAGINNVMVDPTKEKGKKTVSDEDEQVILNETEAPSPSLENRVHIDQEIDHAHHLYQDAKELKNKVISSIKSHKSLDINLVEESTDSMVDSIFRNQDALSCMSQLKDKSDTLVDHALNCSILMAIFAKQLQFDEAIIKELTLGAFLHDIGKVLLDDKLLNKMSNHTDTELERMSKHVAYGAKILEDSSSISNIAMTLIREHHERLDGSGYPLGLKGDQFSKYGQMMAIVDIYDAMTSDRAGKQRSFPIQAFKVLAAHADEFFSETLVNEFIQSIGVYPVGTLVKLTSGKLGLVSQLNRKHPLTPFVRVFYNTRMNQAIAIKEIDLSKPRNNDQIECCIKPEEFNLNLLGFFKAAFLN